LRREVELERRRRLMAEHRATILAATVQRLRSRFAAMQRSGEIVQSAVSAIGKVQ
jgi:hypothetical protein